MLPYIPMMRTAIIKMPMMNFLSEERIPWIAHARTYAADARAAAMTDFWMRIEQDDASLISAELQRGAPTELGMRPRWCDMNSGSVCGELYYYYIIRVILMGEWFYCLCHDGHFTLVKRKCAPKLPRLLILFTLARKHFTPMILLRRWCHFPLW